MNKSSLAVRVMSVLSLLGGSDIISPEDEELVLSAMDDVARMYVFLPNAYPIGGGGELSIPDNSELINFLVYETALRVAPTYGKEIPPDVYRVHQLYKGRLGSYLLRSV